MRRYEFSSNFFNHFFIAFGIIKKIIYFCKKFQSLICILSEKKVKNSIILLFALLMMSMYASAQVLRNADPSEFSIFLGGGLTSIHHKDAPRAGFFNGSAIELGIGYTHFLNRNWGIFLGAGPGIYKTDKFADLDVFTPELTDRNGYRFELYTQSDFNEAFQITFLNIPVMLLYQTKPRNPTWQHRYKNYQSFYMMGGIKAGIPFKNSYESGITRITNAAYYPEMDNWAATQLFAGLGTFNESRDYHGDLELDISFKIALEAGFKWRLNDRFFVYTGAFCDIGVRNTTQETRAPLRNYIAVDHITDFTLLTFSESLNMTTFGVIVRLSFFRSPDRSFCP